VLNKYANINDVTNLKWLPIEERIELSIVKLAHKSLYQEHFPSYLKLNFTEANRALRSNGEKCISSKKDQTVFAEEAIEIFN